MNCFIGLDIGTSAVKGLLLSENGKVVAKAGNKFSYQRDGKLFLLEPEHFLEVCFATIKQLVSNKGKDDEILGICPCCASGNLIFLGNDYKPLTKIIGWQSTIDDEEYSTYYSEEESDSVYKTVGWFTLNGFPVTFLPYYHKHHSDIIEKSKMICMSAEYLNYALTCKFAISNSMATPFYTVDQDKGCYSDFLLERYGIKKEQLPKICNKGTVLGNITEKAAEMTGLSEKTKVVLGCFDHPSCATGSGVYDEGKVLLSCGTSWVEFFPLNDRKKAVETRFLVDRFMINDTKYCVMSSIPSIDLKLNELIRRTIGDISYKELDELILKAEKGCNGLRYSFDDSDYTKAEKYDECDKARAIYESAAILLKNNLEEAESKGLVINDITMVGGITNTSPVMQIIADTLGRDIRVVNGVSAGAAGAAMLAGIGTKVFENERDAFERCHFEEKIYKAQ